MNDPKMVLAAATFAPLDREELALHLAPDTKSGFLGVQQVSDSSFQPKIRRQDAGGFVSLPCSRSVLMAAWYFAAAFKAREDGMLDAAFEAAMKEARACAMPDQLTLPLADHSCVFGSRWSSWHNARNSAVRSKRPRLLRPRLHPSALPSDHAAARASPRQQQMRCLVRFCLWRVSRVRRVRWLKCRLTLLQLILQ